jgi:dTMP kinase
MYILLEGIDGVGKTTQVERLKKRFPDAVFTREPGGTEFGKGIRETLLHSSEKLSPLSELYLFLADRSEHFQRVVKGKELVFSDRGILSGLAYASKTVPEDFLLKANILALENRLPDKIFLFQISKEELLKRRASRESLDKIESRGVEYALEVQERLLFWSEKIGNRVLLDASKSEDELEKEILANLY